MQSDGDSELSLDAQLASKEREWKELQALRVHQLESSLKKAQEECSSLRYPKHYQQLKEDFQFNMVILEERDRELERYDVITTRALTVEHNRYSSSGAELQKLSMAGEIHKQTEEYEKMKWDLQRRIQEVEGEMTRQRQEMTAAFEGELRRREHEFNLKMDEMCAVVLSHELKVRRVKGRYLTMRQSRGQTDTGGKKDKNSKHRHININWRTCVYVCVFFQRLCTEVETTRTCWNQYMSDVSSEMVVKDTEMIALQERETKLRTELERSREETERYKQQLSAGLKREQALEQMRVQVELEWQRRCEDMKAEHYLANEQLIQDLTQARDQGTAELKEKEEELQDLTVLLRSVKTERDQAMQGLTPKVDSLASEEIRRLQEQNNILRAVVTQMRKDMEGLSHRPPPPQAQPQTSAPQLIQHTGAAAATSITPTADTQMTTGPPPQSTDISSKVSPAGGQFAEKRPESSVVRKQEDRVTHTESALANIMEQVLKESGNWLKLIIRDCLLKGHLTSRLVGRYCISCCSNPVSSSLILSSSQSALVQQLQLENLYLKQRQASGQCQNVQGAKSPPVMHTRLKQAASCIAHLSRDKQQLIEMCNRLRAQISTAGLQGTITDTHTYTHARNKENTPPLSRSQSSVDAGLQPRSGLSRSLLSSEESLRSLKELWEKLDNALSPSVFSEGSHTRITF
uniref:Coiled-coil domain containing 57 n=1 Tax=Seriola lalandi dorsalis TaxID=1841481 RepID=A0A3B4XZA2_SERLL